MARRSEIEPNSGDDPRPGAEDAAWVGSFLLTRPGKTYRVDATDDAPDDARRAALAAAARTLIDRVLQGSLSAAKRDEPDSGQP